MVTWKRLHQAAPAEWDKLAARAQDANPFQFYAWGQYKRISGWEPQRWTAERGGKVLACVQFLAKKLWPRAALIWAPGGPLSGFPETRAEDAGELLDEWLTALRGEGAVYARLKSHLPRSAPWAYALSRALRRPLFDIDSRYTVIFDLTASLENLRARMTSKHRYYLKQAEAADLEWKEGNSEELRRDLAFLYSRMTQAKGIAKSSYNPDVLAAMGQALEGNAFILVGYRASRPVTVCLALIGGESAFYLSAATDAAGREVSASYALVWKLIERLKAIGVKRLDFGTVDPRLAGVAHFKGGFGGEIVEYLGEWDWAASEPLRLAANVMIKLKRF